MSLNVKILGIDACRRLDLLRIVEENICEVRESVDARLTEAGLIAKYKDLFEDQLGSIAGTVHLEVDPSISPVQMPLRRIPVVIRNQVQQELHKMVSNGVITPVTTPTPWVSTLLVVAKADGKSIRICIDPTPLNRALQRSTYYMATIDDV